MQTYYLGIDASKGYADFTILNHHKDIVLKNFQLDDTFAGQSCLYEKLCNFYKEHPQSIIYAAIESTGGYENNWYNFLFKAKDKLNLKVTRLNPYGVSNHSKAELNRITTDKISAKNVAEYLISHPNKASYGQKNELAPLKKQWGFIKMLSKQSTQLFNELESMLYIANPELLIYCKNGVSDSILHILQRYPTAAHLSRAKVSSIAKTPYVSHKRAESIVSKAKKSVASSTDEITAQVIMSMVNQILILKKNIASQIEIMIKHYSVPEIDLLKTFIGISDYSAVGLLIEIERADRFSHVKKLSSFFGLHPVYKISGDGIGGFRMSKRGRKEPRRILYMVTLTAIRCNPVIREIYQKHVAKGVHKMAAIGICMHKILRIIYGMLKNNTPFNPEIDRKNREKMTAVSKKKIREDKNRRFQEFDPNAPISRRQHKRRMERKLSHSDNITKFGIIASVPLST